MYISELKGESHTPGYAKETDITAATKAFIESTSKALGRSEAPPKFESQGGTRRDDAALQNLQARCRLVAGYLTAQLLPQQSFPPLLMLSSANLDEALCGYLTKYAREHINKFILLK
ncbi:unnamed protein product [Hymenolepis diminuta]|uniref:NAD_synthase domain-containing protein n=1 Tax=Hymenolepis diminuta TaxID=6216 RepID=A0A0R3SMR0_HYMDI|nr:unnamed protein product [Hymenolepis diminuta]